MTRILHGPASLLAAGPLNVWKSHNLLNWLRKTHARGGHCSGSPRGRSLANPSKGPNGDTKYTIMISSAKKNIKGLSVNRAGEGKNFRKGPSSHNPRPRGRSLADRSVHCQNTIKGCERRSKLKRNITEEEIGGRKAPAWLGNRQCNWMHATQMAENL
jgi:hypothetical protein